MQHLPQRLRPRAGQVERLVDPVQEPFGRIVGVVVVLVIQMAPVAGSAKVTSVKVRPTSRAMASPAGMTAPILREADGAVNAATMWTVGP